jgi:hypothetical protein
MAPQAVLLIGAALSAKSSIDSGNAEKNSAYSEALLHERNAKITRGIAQRDAEREREYGRYIQSDAMAIAAAGGAGTDNANMRQIMAELQTESEYRALTHLYNGETEAYGMELQAAARRDEGRSAARAGKIGAVTSILTAYTGWQSTYGTKWKPKASTGSSYSLPTNYT